jgi:hypothetical protein
MNLETFFGVRDDRRTTGGKSEVILDFRCFGIVRGF